MCMWRIFPPGKYALIHFVGKRFYLQGIHSARFKVSDQNLKYNVKIIKNTNRSKWYKCGFLR